mmetsp:Transcript_57170/g.129535  ORF Transcript_57170/g.129535 Transcript_57170/m.129535 type:complete len:213 (+) Transcript_57170:1735-2373(+)
MESLCSRSSCSALSCPASALLKSSRALSSAARAPRSSSRDAAKSSRAPEVSCLASESRPSSRMPSCLSSAISKRRGSSRASLSIRAQSSMSFAILSCDLRPFMPSFAFSEALTIRIPFSRSAVRASDILVSSVRSEACEDRSPPSSLSSRALYSFIALNSTEAFLKSSSSFAIFSSFRSMAFFAAASSAAYACALASEASNGNSRFPPVVAA